MTQEQGEPGDPAGLDLLPPLVLPSEESVWAWLLRYGSQGPLWVVIRECGSLPAWQSGAGWLGVSHRAVLARACDFCLVLTSAATPLYAAWASGGCAARAESMLPLLGPLAQETHQEETRALTPESTLGSCVMVYLGSYVLRLHWHSPGFDTTP